MLFNHLEYYRLLQVGIRVATSLTEVCDVLLGTLGLSLDRFFPRRENRELKLKHLRKLFDNINILCFQEVQGKDEYLQAIQVLAPRFRFLVPSSLETRTQGGRPYASTRNFWLRMLL